MSDPTPTSTPTPPATQPATTETPVIEAVPVPPVELHGHYDQEHGAFVVNDVPER